MCRTTRNNLMAGIHSLLIRSGLELVFAWFVHFLHVFSRCFDFIFPCCTLTDTMDLSGSFWLCSCVYSSNFFCWVLCSSGGLSFFHTFPVCNTSVVLSPRLMHPIAPQGKSGIAMNPCLCSWTRLPVSHPDTL